MLYSYKCDKCEEIWDETHKMDDRKIPEGLPCPKCNEEGSVRQYLGGGVPSLIHEPSNTMSKNTPDGWRDTLREMKKTYKVNNIKIP